jgi:ABC-type transport system involved in Fe-S cluster assembly fused permease/ATPase subunit
MECGVGRQDVTGLDVASVRDSDALVSQDSTLFNEDVAYNIAYGNPKADAFAVGDAARNAQVQHVA